MAVGAGAGVHLLRSSWLELSVIEGGMIGWGGGVMLEDMGTVCGEG